MSKIKINRDYREKKQPVLHHYEGQTKPQEAFILMDEYGIVSVTWNAETGNAMPISVWQGLVLRFAISPYLTREDIDELLDEITPLLHKVRDGHVIEECDVTGTYAGVLSAEAQEARLKIDRLCDAKAPTPVEKEKNLEVWNEVVGIIYADVLQDIPKESIKHFIQKGAVKIAYLKDTGNVVHLFDSNERELGCLTSVDNYQPVVYFFDENEREIGYLTSVNSYQPMYMPNRDWHPDIKKKFVWELVVKSMRVID